MRAFFRRNRARSDNSACMLVATIVLACAPEGSLGSDRPAGTDSGGATQTGTEATGTEATGTEATGTAGLPEGSGDDSASSSTAASSSGPSSSGGSDEGTTTAVDACVPDGEDTPCITCVKGHCCAEQTACQASEPCACIETCIADGGDAATCIAQCGGQDADWTHLHDCSVEHCIGVC